MYQKFYKIHIFLSEKGFFFVKYGNYFSTKILVKVHLLSLKQTNPISLTLWDWLLWILHYYGWVLGILTILHLKIQTEMCLNIIWGISYMNIDYTEICPLYWGKRNVLYLLNCKQKLLKGSTVVRRSIFVLIFVTVVFCVFLPHITSSFSVIFVTFSLSFQQCIYSMKVVYLDAFLNVLKFFPFYETSCIERKW